MPRPMAAAEQRRSAPPTARSRPRQARHCWTRNSGKPSGGARGGSRRELGLLRGPAEERLAQWRRRAASRAPRWQARQGAGCPQSISALAWACSTARAAGGGATRKAEPARRAGIASGRGAKTSTSAEPGVGPCRSSTDCLRAEAAASMSSRVQLGLGARDLGGDGRGEWREHVVSGRRRLRAGRPVGLVGVPGVNGRAQAVHSRRRGLLRGAPARRWQESGAGRRPPRPTAAPRWAPRLAEACAPPGRACTATGPDQTGVGGLPSSQSPEGPRLARSEGRRPACLADQPLEVELADDAQRGEVLEVRVVHHPRQRALAVEEAEQPVHLVGDLAQSRSASCR